MTGRAARSNRSRQPRHASLRPFVTACIAVIAVVSLGGGWALARSGGLFAGKTVVTKARKATPHRALRRIGISKRLAVSRYKPSHGHHEHSHNEPEPPVVTPEEPVSEGVPVESPSSEPPAPEEESPPPPEAPEEPAPEEPAPPNTVARAIWTPPTNAQVDVSVTLDGTTSEGDGPLACTWSFEDQSGGTVWETHTGCQLPFVFQIADTKYVKLTVRDADGESASSRQSFVVHSPPAVEEPEPPVEEPEPPVEEPEPPVESDTTPPQTTITAQPPASTTETSASFSFSSSESGSSFACKLDTGNWASCASPKSYSGLSVGSHSFSVRATDAAGNTDATPATKTWTIEAVEEEVEEEEEESPTGTSHCYSSPHSCGYPDATNTGASGTLAPSGSITVSTNGTVVKDKEVSGKITINADNVTIENVKIVQTATGSGTQAISNNGSGNVIRNVTAGGKGTGSNTIEAAIRGFNGVTLERDYFYNCNECMQGTGTVKDSYMIVSSIYSGAHAEDIYVCSETITVEHSTLINSVNQTATVFGDTICGGGNKFTVKNSLLAGSGYVFYPQANNTNPSGAQTTITGNHIARCLGSAETKENGHWYCKGGSDSNGLYPYGGSYGVGAYFSGPVTWSGNVWDDNLSTIPQP